MSVKNRIEIIYLPLFELSENKPLPYIAVAGTQWKLTLAKYK